MWDNFGKQVQTFLLIFIVVLLSLIMGVVGFGSPGAEGGCNMDGPGYAAKVYDVTITEGDFRAAYTITGFIRQETAQAQRLRLKELTLDGLIERELLAREARRLGFTADPDEVMRHVAEDEVVLLGGPVNAPDGYPAGELRQSFSDDGVFSAENMRRFIQYHLRRSVEEFVDWQVKETLANQVRDTIGATVSVSPREVWDSYAQETERARLSFVRFDPSFYAERVEVTDEAVRAWMSENQEAVDTEYSRQRHEFTNLPAQRRARHILIEAPASMPEAERAEARTRAEGLLAQVQGGADFAALAREHSSDEVSAANGGELEDWFARDGQVEQFAAAAFETEPGNVVDHVVESRYGFHVIEVLGARQGDVEPAVAKRELAERLYREARAGELAHEAATRALEYAEDHTMEELDERLRNDWAEAPTPPTEPAEGETPDAGGEAEPPAERDPRAPQVRETRSFGRGSSPVPGPFESATLAQAAFEMTLEEPLPEEPMQLGESWFVYRLTERTTAEPEGFDDETRDRIERGLLTGKRREVIAAYIARLRDVAEAEGAILTNTAILSYGPEAGEEDGEEAEETASN